MSHISVPRSRVLEDTQVVFDNGFLDASEMEDHTTSAEVLNAECRKVLERCLEGKFIRIDSVNNDVIRAILSALLKGGLSCIKVLHDQCLLEIAGQRIPYSLYKDLAIFYNTALTMKNSPKDPIPPHLIEFMKGSLPF
jgi:hypothetical protein